MFFQQLHHQYIVWSLKHLTIMRWCLDSQTERMLHYDPSYSSICWVWRDLKVHLAGCYYLKEFQGDFYLIPHFFNKIDLIFISFQFHSNNIDSISVWFHKLIRYWIFLGWFNDRVEWFDAFLSANVATAGQEKIISIKIWSNFIIIQFYFFVISLHDNDMVGGEMMKTRKFKILISNKCIYKANMCSVFILFTFFSNRIFAAALFIFSDLILLTLPKLQKYIDKKRLRCEIDHIDNIIET